MADEKKMKEDTEEKKRQLELRRLLAEEEMRKRIAEEKRLEEQHRKDEERRIAQEKRRADCKENIEQALLRRKPAKYMDLSSAAGLAELLKLANEETFVEEGWERAVVEERVVEEQEGGRGKRVEEQERGSGSQGITTTPWTLADEGCCSESNVPSKRFHRGPGYHIVMEEVSQGSVWDSHCHLDFLARKLNRENVKGGESLVKSLQSDGQNLGDRFGGCIANFCDPRDWGQEASKVLNSCKSQNRVFLTLGCHPHFADKMDSSSIGQLQRLAREMKGKVVAIGECGLDKSGKNRVPMDVQMKYFGAQIDVARDLNLPLVLHIRGAEEEAKELLKRKQVPANYRIHYHCFTGTLKAAEAWLSSYPASKIGLTGLVTFTHAKSVREVASGLPLDKLLLETDAPYFLPSGVSKENYRHTFSQPGHVIHVAAQVGQAYIHVLHLNQSPQWAQII